MNTQTGQIYSNLKDEQLKKLQDAGVPVVRVSPEVAEVVELGQAVQKVYRVQHARRLEEEARKASLMENEQTPDL